MIAIQDADTIETPAIVVDLDILDANLRRTAALAANAGVKLRPHVKTHKNAWIAKRQLEYGAVGITVAKLGEAEVMADSGVDDILIAYPLVGAAKLKRLSELMRRANVTVSVDHPDVVRGLSELGESLKRRIPLYVDVNTGLNRCGKEPGPETAALVRELSRYPGVDIRGLMTHAGHAYGDKTPEAVRRTARHEADSLVETRALLREWGIEVPEISVGSTPTSKFIGEQRGVTEMRPGAYVFGDRSQLSIGVIAQEECALGAWATVVGLPRPGTAIVDAGSKTISNDANPHVPGFGQWADDPRVVLARLSEEHGVVQVPDDVKLRIGQKMLFIPNHCCAAVNLQDRLYGIREGRLERTLEVDARGKIQ